MKLKFKFCGSERRISAFNDNEFGQHIIRQPNVFTLTFVSEHGDIELKMTLDERNQAAMVIAEGMQNEYFEFDFSQPMPQNRLNSPLPAPQSEDNN